MLSRDPRRHNIGRQTDDSTLVHQEEEEGRGGRPYARRQVDADRTNWCTDGGATNRTVRGIGGAVAETRQSNACAVRSVVGDMTTTADGQITGSSGSASSGTAVHHVMQPADWVRLALPGVIWGSSFYFIAEGLDWFEPALITPLRVLFGLLTLLAFPAAPAPIDRGDRPAHRGARRGLVGGATDTLPVRRRARVVERHWHAQRRDAVVRRDRGDDARPTAAAGPPAHRPARRLRGRGPDRPAVARRGFIERGSASP